MSNLPAVKKVIKKDGIEMRIVDQNKLTSDCWLIQFSGLSACENCPELNTKECGGQAIRKKLLKK